MANTGLRPDESARLEYRDVIITDEATGERILEIEVRGKRGVGFARARQERSSRSSGCKSATRQSQRTRFSGKPRVIC